MNGVVLAKDMEAAMTALGRQVGGNQLAMFVVWGFLVGIFAVWLYAGISCHAQMFGGGRNRRYSRV